MFKTPRLIILRGAHKSDPTFLEKSEKDPLTKREKAPSWVSMKMLNTSGITGNRRMQVERSSTFKVRRIMLVYLVDKNGKQALANL